MQVSEIIIKWIRMNLTRRPRKIGKRGRDDLYRCWCPEHGYFEDIKHGWDEVIICSECFSERVRKWMK